MKDLNKYCDISSEPFVHPISKQNLVKKCEYTWLVSQCYGKYRAKNNCSPILAHLDLKVLLNLFINSIKI